MEKEKTETGERGEAFLAEIKSAPEAFTRPEARAIGEFLRGDAFAPFQLYELQSQMVSFATRDQDVRSEKLDGPRRGEPRSGRRRPRSPLA